MAGPASAAGAKAQSALPPGLSHTPHLPAPCSWAQLRDAGLPTQWRACLGHPPSRPRSFPPRRQTMKPPCRTTGGKWCRRQRRLKAPDPTSPAYCFPLRPPAARFAPHACGGPTQCYLSVLVVRGAASRPPLPCPGPAGIGSAGLWGQLEKALPSWPVLLSPTLAPRPCSILAGRWPGQSVGFAEISGGSEVQWVGVVLPIPPP